MENKHKKRVIKYADFFCGLGAFHIAFSKCCDFLEYKCVFACDIDKNIQKIYKFNFNIDVFGDINTIDIVNIPDFDILCAGFPCQSFSIAGKMQGFDDEKRGMLFFLILKIIDIKKPSVVFLENVYYLLKIDNGKVMNFIIDSLKNRGYFVSYKVLNSKYFNCPQSRLRVYIIACKNKQYIFNELQMPIVSVKSIIDFSYKHFFDYRKLKYIVKADEKYYKENNSKLLYKLICKISGKGGRQGEKIYSLNSCGPTICARAGALQTEAYYFGKNSKRLLIRKLNIQEVKKMFNFPIDFKHCVAHISSTKMIYYFGNSIVVNVLIFIINSFYQQNIFN